MEASYIRKLADSYRSFRIATLGSHSALDICEGAKREGIKTLVVCQKGRERTYQKYYSARKRLEKGIGCVDEIMLLDKFSNIATPAVVKQLQRKNAVFIPHRSFSVYVGYDAIEKSFEVPIFGNRFLLRAEERDAPRNQLYLLKKAGIRTPKSFSKPSDIDRLALVKASEARRSYERAFFFASSEEEYERESSNMLKKGIVTEEGLKAAPIEEFVVGAQYNFNYFYSPLNEELELIGTDTRRQTNLDGLLKLPAREQLEVLKHLRMKNIEIGHVACTLRESMLEKVFDIGEKFVGTCRREYPPGLIGAFALQGAIVPEEKGEEIIIFDVSFRLPGSPGVRFTPYTEYLYGESLSMGRRTAIEIKNAFRKRRLGEVVT
ncbi:MAG: 5-formaminoimidazole-4-carboxamide-1-(Beta)-D-rib ofuranosyl 5'-monophosphate synthetase [Candidatus Fermentimicrarchaeum limneticum]|uniref:5-formaminoimidazole-4-carboxamide-1-(Beta)-D-rib ofuranosyl 5'-monophosphate synthetase n=1 Tax=Fermentimicrarchaeum limneticum TaxID=2795018 RepID=A0A7D5XDH7_FERL1|nr:MAG: 5-formaminoimidazole-4-carboxamide-1-(Beta)-D-rib ofuranosyl 5'-monophosphate synthetase [Candidatus Fermentimicrarchaeum limneticum]